MSHQSPFNKVGWAWTKHGWKRIPHRPKTPKFIAPVQRRRAKKHKPLSPANPPSAHHHAGPDAPHRPLEPHPQHYASAHARQRHKPPLRPCTPSKYAALRDLHNG